MSRRVLGLLLARLPRGVAAVLNETAKSMLAQPTGSYREQSVSSALRDHFACAWVHQLPGGGTSSIVVVPDGSIDLQWVGGG
jgi:hypothetical protein